LTGFIREDYDVIAEYNQKVAEFLAYSTE